MPTNTQPNKLGNTNQNTPPTFDFFWGRSKNTNNNKNNFCINNNNNNY